METPNILPPVEGDTQKENNTKAPSFTELNRLRKDTSLDDETRRFHQASYEKRISDFSNLDGNTWVIDMQKGFRKRMRDNDWDDLYEVLGNYAANFESNFKGSDDGMQNDRLVGISTQAIKAEAARVLIEGIDSKKIRKKDKDTWLRNKDYTKEEIERLTKIASEDKIFDLATDVPTELVGKNIKKTTPEPTASNEVADLLRDLRDLQSANLMQSSEQTKALQRGFDVMVGLTQTRTAISPDVFESQPPFWYEKLSRDEKEAVKNILIFNYISGTMVKTGEATYGPWAALGDPEKGYVPLINSEAINYQFKNLPGFRVALATMTNDIFTKGLNTGALYIRDDGEDNKGYKLMSSTVDFKQYKKDLIRSLADYYQSRPSDIAWAEERKMTPEGMATLMVSAVDNFLMGTTSYLSGDMKRPYDPRNNDGGTFRYGIEDPGQNGGDDIRAFLQPGLKLPKKLIKEGDKYSTKEEFWLGSFGKWMRFNSINNIDGFRDDYVAGKINYVPNKLFPGLLEFTTLRDGRSSRTVADLLVNKNKYSLSRGTGLVDQLVDYVGGGDSIDFTKGNDEWFGAYNGKRGQAIALYENIGSSGGQRTNALTVEKFFNALERLRNMEAVDLIPELKETYYSEDFIIANLAQIISQGEGPVLGIREIVLNIDPKLSYDGVVNQALSGQANILNNTGLNRKKVLKIFNANDTSRLSGQALFSAFGLGSSAVGRVERLKKKAQRNRERVARRY